MVSGERARIVKALGQKRLLRDEQYGRRENDIEINRIEQEIDNKLFDKQNYEFLSQDQQSLDKEKADIVGQINRYQ